MKIILQNVFLILLVMEIIAGCNSTSKLYRNDGKNRVYAGEISDSNYLLLKEFLTNSTNAKLKDTIIIKYDYNKETCWDLLDQKSDDYIKPFITSRQARIQQILATRQNVSVFSFREPGNNVNKITKWDRYILVDSSKQLYNLLFKERSICGNSIIIMPDKKFVFLRSDSHSEALNYSQEQIENLLNKK